MASVEVRQERAGEVEGPGRRLVNEAEVVPHLVAVLQERVRDGGRFGERNAHDRGGRLPRAPVPPGEGDGEEHVRHGKG